MFAEHWLARRRLIRGSTEAGYGSIINRQLVPRLGSIAVSDLRFEHVDAAVSGMIEDELSSKTIHNAVTLLRTILTGPEHDTPPQGRERTVGQIGQCPAGSIAFLACVVT
jgi:hypothetical protein